MSVIEVTRSHELDHEQAKSAADNLARSLSEQFSVNYEWEQDVLRFQRKGAKGQLEVNPAEIHVRLELGILLSPFKDKIEREIHQHLDHLMAS